MYETEQTWRVPAVMTGHETGGSLKEPLFKRILRKIFPDQRKQPRLPAPPLVGYLGTMRGSRPFEVADVGLGGFSLVTGERWEPGTEMPITLQRFNVGADEPEDRFTVQATAVRWTEDGVAFSIVLFEEESNAVSDNPLQVSWASREDMKLFLNRMKSPQEMMAPPSDRETSSADERSLKAAFAASFHVSPHTAGD